MHSFVIIILKFPRIAQFLKITRIYIIKFEVRVEIIPYYKYNSVKKKSVGSSVKVYKMFENTCYSKRVEYHFIAKALMLKTSRFQNSDFIK